MFRPRRHLPRPVLCCLCTGGPVGPRISPIPAALPARTRTSTQRVPLPLPSVTSHPSQNTKPFRIRTSTKPVRNPFRIRTSKTQDLKLFRMNTYKKTGEGGGAHLSNEGVSIFEFPFSNFALHLSLPTAHHPLLTFHFCYPNCSSKEPHAVAAPESDS